MTRRAANEKTRASNDNNAQIISVITIITHFTGQITVDPLLNPPPPPPPHTHILIVWETTSRPLAPIFTRTCLVGVGWVP